MARYGKHGEQTYRQNFNRRKKGCIDWFLLNLSLARRVLDMDGLLAIAIDPCYISKAGKKTPHIGRFWSGCAGAVKHGLEIKWHIWAQISPIEELCALLRLPNQQTSV